MTLPACVENRIIDTIGTFRRDALIVADDIRFASLADGLDLSDVPAHVLTAVIRRRCDVAPCRTSNNGTLWVRRW